MNPSYTNEYSNFKEQLKLLNPSMQITFTLNDSKQIVCNYSDIEAKNDLLIIKSNSDASINIIPLSSVAYITGKSNDHVLKVDHIAKYSPVKSEIHSDKKRRLVLAGNQTGKTTIILSEIVNLLRNKNKKIFDQAFPPYRYVQIDHAFCDIVYATYNSFGLKVFADKLKCLMGNNINITYEGGIPKYASSDFIKGKIIFISYESYLGDLKQYDNVHSFYFDEEPPLSFVQCLSLLNQNVNVLCCMTPLNGLSESVKFMKRNDYQEYNLSVDECNFHSKERKEFIQDSYTRANCISRYHGMY